VGAEVADGGPDLLMAMGRDGVSSIFEDVFQTQTKARAKAAAEKPSPSQMNLLIRIPLV
jgi:hypothetical protein